MESKKPARGKKTTAATPRRSPVAKPVKEDVPVSPDEVSEIAEQPKAGKKPVIGAVGVKPCQAIECAWHYAGCNHPEGEKQAPCAKYIDRTRRR